MGGSLAKLRRDHEFCADGVCRFHGCAPNGRYWIGKFSILKPVAQAHSAIFQSGG